MKSAALLLLLALTACSAVDSGPGDGSGAEAVALAALTAGPTYAYDGSNATVISATGDDVSLTFLSTHAGYGDRSGSGLPEQQVIHTASVRIENGKTASIIIDGKWDEIRQRPLDAASGNVINASFGIVCGKTIPDPFVIYANGSLQVTYFAETTGCGNATVEYSFDHSTYPPKMVIVPGEPTEKCADVPCETIGTSMFTIPVKEVGEVVIRTPRGEHSTPFGRFQCSSESCPDGYICAMPERGGICIVNSTEDMGVVYERYANRTA